MSEPSEGGKKLTVDLPEEIYSAYDHAYLDARRCDPSLTRMAFAAQVIRSGIGREIPDESRSDPIPVEATVNLLGVLFRFQGVQAVVDLVEFCGSHCSSMEGDGGPCPEPPLAVEA